MEDALSHELVHAWDGRRFDVEGEWGKDLRAHACTEVRKMTLRFCCSVLSLTVHRFEQRTLVEIVDGVEKLRDGITVSRNSIRCVPYSLAPHRC